MKEGFIPLEVNSVYLGPDWSLTKRKTGCVRFNQAEQILGGPTRGLGPHGFGSPHARNGRLAAVTRKITVGVRGNDAQ